MGETPKHSEANTHDFPRQTSEELSTTEVDDTEYPSIAKVIPIMLALSASMFLVALVSTYCHHPFPYRINEKSV